MDNGTNALTVQNSNAWVEVSASALQHNIGTLQAELAGKSKLCAVLKADAYGHGIGLVMPSIIAQGVPCVAVASNEEARVVRASGFTGQLVRVRLASLSELEDGLQYDMEELVGSAEFARQVDAIAARHGKTLRIHMALNSSGMSRNGVEMATWSGRGEALQITDQKHLKLVALMTHFAVEDKDDVRKGLAAFNEQTEWLIKHAKLDRSKLTLHAANSFATLEVPEARLDMVRTGARCSVTPCRRAPSTSVRCSSNRTWLRCTAIRLATPWAMTAPSPWPVIRGWPTLRSGTPMATAGYSPTRAMC